MVDVARPIPSVMRAAVARVLGQPLVIEQVPVPAPGSGEVLIEVIACGICHSDVHAADGDWGTPPLMPLIPGHEVAGRVVALGEGVTDLQVGQLVGVPWMFWSCGMCEWCLAGMETVCPATESTGFSKAGGYAEYMVAAASFVATLPESVDPVAIAPILCAGVTTYRGLKRTGLRPGQWVAVLGVGGLGHIAVQYAAAMGLRVVALDVDDEKLALASSLGAERVVNSRVVDPVAAVREVLGGTHGSIVTAAAPVAFEQAVGLLRPGGTAVYIGLPGHARDTINTSISRLVESEITVRGSNVGTRLDLQEAVDFAVRGRVASTVRTVTLDDVNEVFADMRAGRIVGRVVLQHEAR